MTTILEALANTEFSPRNAAGELRQRLLQYLLQTRPEVGTRLATEAQIVSALRVSRSTVRRALDPLEKEGWIDRRAGAGTFVGKRILAGDPTDLAPPTPQTTLDEMGLERRRRGIVRVALLIFNIGDLAHDWYTPGILQGLDSAGHEHRVVVELLGDRDSDIDAIARRLALSRPDALICLSNNLRHAFLLRDAQKLGIQCFISGTPLSALDLPGTSEDNRQAMDLAVRHLIDLGHSAIGLCLPRLPEPWVFHRLESYTQQMQSAGLEPHVLWTSAGRPESDDTQRMEQFIHAHRLTALIPAHSVSMRTLSMLVETQRVTVPDQLSVVSFEQDHPERGYLGFTDATRLVFPLRDMGATLALMARTLADGRPLEQPFVVFPATLVPGATTAPPSAPPSAT